MILNLNTWNGYSYNEFLNYLYDLQDLKYKQFHFKLLKNDKINLIGVRTPLLHKISKEISKGNYKEFIMFNKFNTYEELTINGLLLGYLKINFYELLNLITDYIPNINNWASCDLTCSNLKIFNKNKEVGFTYLKGLLKSKNPWTKRFVIVMFLDYYLDDQYIDLVLKLIMKNKCHDYYVDMAIAWLLSVSYIKYQSKTINTLNSLKMNDFVVKQTIKKIKESYRINKKEKSKIKELF